MKKEPSFSLYFRTGLKAEIKFQGAPGYGFFDMIAKEAGISRKYLSDIANGREAGTEAIRRDIAESLGHTYSELLLIGKELSHGKPLGTAHKSLWHRHNMRPEEDGYIEDILEIWNCLAKDAKEIIRKNTQRLAFECWIHSGELTLYTEKTPERLFGSLNESMGKMSQIAWMKLN